MTPLLLAGSVLKKIHCVSIYQWGCLCHPESSEGVDLKITSVSMNRPLSKAQGSIKKISPLMKPMTMAVGGVNHEDRVDDPEPDSPRSKRQSQRQNPIDTLGSEVDVWV